MDVSCRATRIVIEGAEAAGIPRARLALGGPITLEHLTDTRKRVEWKTFAELVDRVSHEVDDDPERLRNIGRLMLRAPSNPILQKLASQVVSLRALYIAGNRWVAPALFPGLKLEMEFLGERLVRIRASLAPSYRDCLGFFYISEGNIAELPRLMGGDPAIIERSEVTPRSAVTDLLLPPRERLLARGRRFLQSRTNRHETTAIVENQQREIQRGLEAITSASEEFRTVLDRLPDLVLIHRAGNLLWVNRATAALLGYPSTSDLIGIPLMSIVDESSRALLQERMSAPAGDASLPALTEARVLRRDGSVATVEVAPAERVTFGGAPARLVVARDVTERLRMQKRLMTADRLASMGLVAAGVAHEINNPLAYVLNNIQIASRELSRDPSPKRKASDALGTALEGVFRIRDIVHDLVTLSRSETVPLQPVDLRATLESTLTLAHGELASGVSVVRTYKACPAAKANAARLGQVFLNLITNAVDAMPKDSPANELRLSTSTDARGRAVIEVSDNGVGIAPEVLGRVFEPFFTTKAAGRGTGLGLAISYEIVQELGGEISVDSILGKGTTFRVALPPWGASA